MAITLSLNKKDPWKGVKLEFYATDDEPEAAWVEVSQDFVGHVYSLMPKETGWFHQSGVKPDNSPSNYHMFEFWLFDIHAELVRAKSKEIADLMGLPLEVSI
jgi:hypothetical protein